MELHREAHRQLAGLYPEGEIDSFVRILFKRYIIRYHVSDPPDEAKQRFFEAIGELKKYRPIQYILGETEFYGLHFDVCPDVLIPRPETEELVDWIVHEYKPDDTFTIVDIGAGSGCIAVALKKYFRCAEMWAIDVSEPALAVARKNAAKNGVTINFLLKDVLNDGMMGFEHKSIDVIVSNPPYVTPSEKQNMLPNVLEYEPHCALFTPENDPLIFYKAIAAFGKKSLKTGGKLFFEINEAYLDKVSDVLQWFGFHDITPRKDINGKWRMICAKL